MSLKLMYITNKKEIAKIAENNGVDWIFIDLEMDGKKERQFGLDTVISNHTYEDIEKMSHVLNEAKLLVRVNPIGENSINEIETVISKGADIVMLPYFKTKLEVEKFIKIVNGRTETCLLLETKEAVENIDSILDVEGIDFIHIGLNDMHLSYKMKFMFEPLTNGIIESLSKKIKAKGIPFGFGGIAQIGKGLLPAEYIITEHYRLGSSSAILSRSFCDTSIVKNLKEIKNTFKIELGKIRELEEDLLKKDNSYFESNKENIQKIISQIINKN